LYSKEGRLIKYVVQPGYKTKMNGQKEEENPFITGGLISTVKVEE
jgi:hypothetical protein